MVAGRPRGYKGGMRRRLVLALLVTMAACGDSEGASEGSSGSGEATGASASTTATSGASTAATATATTDAGTGTGEAESDGEADVWKTPACFLVSDSKWIAAWIAQEDEVLARVNDARMKGTTCGAAGAFAPVAPLTMQDHLRCAARVHSKDMSERGYLEHVNPDGEGPGARIDETGYAYQSAGENIAGGPPTAAEVVAGWLASDEHCAILMSPNWQTSGVGFYEGEGPFTYYWTQTFAQPK